MNPPTDAGYVPQSRQLSESPGTLIDRAVTLVRAVATVLILYGTLLGLWADLHHEQAGLLTAIRHWINRPLGVGEDFTMLGVMLLLLATGYQTCRVGRSARQGRALRIRLIRLYATILVANTIGVILTYLHATIWTEPFGVRPGFADYLRDITLVNHVASGLPLLAPLGWVIGLEMVAWLVAVLPVKSPAAVETGQLVVVAGVLLSAAVTGGLTQSAVVVSFYPLVVIGALICRAMDGELPVWTAVLLSCLGWGMLVCAEHLFPALDGWWYPLSAAYAALSFAVAAALGGEVADRIASHPVVDWLATRVHWLILLAGVLGFPVLAWAQGKLPLLVGVLSALAVTAIGADAAYRAAMALEAGGRYRHAQVAS